MANNNKLQLVAANSTYSQYPGLKGEIKDHFEKSSKIVFVRYFHIICNCFPLSELLDTTACLNRQFRSMTYSYFHNQISGTEKIINLFLDHFLSLKKEDGESLFPKRLSILLDIQNKFNEQLKVTYSIASEFVDYRKFCMSVISTTDETLQKIADCFKSVRKNNLPKQMIQYLDGALPDPRDKLPNQYHRMMVVFAMHLEIQPKTVFSPDLKKWIIKSIHFGEFKLVKAVYDKMELNKLWDSEYNPFFAYSFTKMGFIKKALGVVAQVDHRTARVNNFLKLNRGIPYPDMIFNNQRIACSIHLAQIENCPPADLRTLFVESTRLLSVTEDPQQFFGFDEIALAYLKKTGSNQPLQAEICEYFFNQLQGVNCDKALDFLGERALSEGNINLAINIFYQFSAFSKNTPSTSGMTLGRKIIKFLLTHGDVNAGIQMTSQFINHPRILPNKREVLLQFLVYHLLDIGQIDRAMEIASNMTDVDYQGPHSYGKVNMKVCIHLAERKEIERLHAITIRRFIHVFRKCEKIVRTLLDYHGPKITREFIDSLEKYTILKNTDYYLSILVKFYLEKKDVKSVDNIIAFLDSKYKGKHNECLLEYIKYFEKIDQNKSYECMKKYKKNFNDANGYLFPVMYINSLIRRNEKEKAKKFIRNLSYFKFNDIISKIIEKIDNNIEIKDLWRP